MEKVKGASIIFVNQYDQVLLLLRDNKPEIPFPNQWDVLGGRVEPGESPEDCIVREMCEELSFNLESPQLFKVDDQGNKTEYTYWRRENIDIDSIALNEGQKLKWFWKEEIEAMPDDAIAYEFKSILLDFFDFYFMQE